MYKRKILKTIITFVLAISPLLLFESYLFSVFTNSILGNLFFSFDKRVLIADFIFVIYFITIVFFYISKRNAKYHFSTLYYLIISSIFFYFLSFRLIPAWRPNLQFIFIKSGIIGIAYLDLIFAAIFLGHIIYLLSLKKRNKIDTKNSLILDDSITEISKDDLEYNNIAKKIADKIFQINNSNHSFNIGIVGSWGIGKTTLLNYIKNELNSQSKHGESEHILFQYSPLLQTDSPNLTNDFLIKLNSKLKKYSIESSATTRKYIYSLKDSFSSFGSVFIKPFITNVSYEENAQELSDIIKKINRKIIVLIDDLDRLNRQEVHEILRLIRNICDFNNMIFIIAYDKNYIIEKLREDNNLNPELFLEKFFSAEIEMPKITDDLIRKDFITYVEKLMPNRLDSIETLFNLAPNPIISKTKSFKGTSSFDIQFFDNNIITKRDVKRLVNNLILIPDEVFHEASTANILTIELLRLKFYRAYSDIKSKKILTEDSGYYKFNGKQANLKKNADDEEIFPDEPPYQIIKKLFEDKEKDSISNILRFDLYFSNNVNRIIQFSELMKLRASKADANTIIEQINKWKKDNVTAQKQIVSYLDEIQKFDSLDDFETMIQVMISVDEFQNYNNTKIIDFIIAYFGKGELKDEISSFIDKLLRDTIPLGDKYSFYYSLYDKSYHDDDTSFPITESNLKDICLERLNKFVISDTENYEKCFNLYYLCREKVDKVNDVVVLQSDAHSAMLSYINIYPWKYIKLLIRPLYIGPLQDSIDGGFTLEPFLIETFSGWSNFQEFIKKFKNSNQENHTIINELTKYEAFFKLYHENKYQGVKLIKDKWPMYGIDKLVKENKW